MITIWKFPLAIDDRQVISMPAEASILTVQTQDNRPCLWALVNSENPIKMITIRMFGTGHPIEGGPYSHLHYLGTFQSLHGSLVFHVFEEENKDDIK